MKKHHLVLKEKTTDKIFYTPTDLEVFGGVLSLTRTPEEIKQLFERELPEYEIIGEQMMV